MGNTSAASMKEVDALHDRMKAKPADLLSSGMANAGLASVLASGNANVKFEGNTIIRVWKGTCDT